MGDLFSSCDIPPPAGPYRVPPSQARSVTSAAAADAIEPVAGRLRRKVLAAIRAAGADGMTDEDVQDVLFMPGSTERPRRVELVEAGLVVDSGRTRKTRAGKSATVWVIRND